MALAGRTRFVLLVAASAGTVGLWLVLLLADETVGLGLLSVPGSLLVSLLLFHLATAPVGWVTAIRVLGSEGRVGLAWLGAVLVPLLAIVSLGVAMTDAWAWNTAAAKSSGRGTYFVAVAIVASGPLSFLVFLLAGLRSLSGR